MSFFGKKKSILIFLIVLLSLPLVSSYEIVGNSVIEEDAYSRLEVFPHTVVSPVPRDLEQTFRLTNKTGSTQNVYLGYIYDEPLVSGKIEKVIPAVYDWVSHQFVCDYDFVYSMNEYPGEQNDNYAKCFTTNDANAIGDPADDYNVVHWEGAFRTGDVGAKTLNYDVWEITQDEYKNDVTSSITHGEKLGKHVYYYNSTIAIGAGETFEWVKTYTPNARSGKWELIYYTGASASCILNDTCMYVNTLDPWWDLTFEQRFAINISGTHSAITADEDTIRMLNIDTSTFNCSVSEDTNRIALVSEASGTATELDMLVAGSCGGDMNFFFQTDTDIPANGTLNASDTNGFRFYVTNSVVASPKRDADNVTIDSATSGLTEAWDIDANLFVFPEETIQGRKGVEDLNTLRLIATTDNPFWTSQAYTGYAYANNNTGSDNAVVLANETSLGDNVNTGTIEFWFLINDALATSKRILSWGDNGDSGRGEVWTESTANKLTMSIDADQAGGGWVSTEESGTISAATWHHFAFTWGVGSQKMYVDNILVASATTGSIIFDFDTGSLNIGGKVNDQSYDMIVDDIIFWDTNRGTFAQNHIADPPDINIGVAQDISEASFTVVLDPSSLDPAEGITTIVADLNDTSAVSPNTIDDWNYFIDTVQFYHSTTDGNTTRNFTTVGDFNVSLIITLDDASFLQQDQTVSIVQVAQNVDINFSLNTFSVNDANVNFGVTFDGSADAFNWSVPGDANVLTRNVTNKLFTSPGEKEVCVTTTTSDVNKTTCENFVVGRVIVKKPLNISNLAELTPFDMTGSANPTQAFTGLSVDSNMFFFSDTNFSSSITIDMNAEFFTTSRIFNFNNILNDFIFQSYLVPVSGNLATTIFTIDNINQKQTIPGIKIVSETVIGGTLIEVESKLSDITGTAEFHFEIGRNYVLSFFDSDDALIFTGTLNAKSTDTTLFAALAQRQLFAEAAPTSSFNLSWIPIVSQINPGSDGNITISNVINPFNTVVGDVNVFISHLTDSNIVFQQVFTLDSSDQNQTITYDLNVAGFNDNFLLKVSVQVFDVNGLQITNVYVKNYSFKTTRVISAFEALKEEFGAFPIMFMVIIFCAAIIGLITLFSPTTNNNWIGVIAIILTAFFVIISWIPVEAWLVSASMTVGMLLWRDREQ